MKASRAALAAFLITGCILAAAGGLVLVGLRCGRVLFGEGYEPFGTDMTAIGQLADAARFLPVRWQAVMRLPAWEAALAEWFLPK